MASTHFALPTISAINWVVAISVRRTPWLHYNFVTGVISSLFSLCQDRAAMNDHKHVSVLGHLPWFPHARFFQPVPKFARRQLSIPIASMRPSFLNHTRIRRPSKSLLPKFLTSRMTPLPPGWTSAGKAETFSQLRPLLPHQSFSSSRKHRPGRPQHLDTIWNWWQLPGYCGPWIGFSCLPNTPHFQLSCWGFHFFCCFQSFNSNCSKLLSYTSTSRTAASYVCSTYFHFSVKVFNSTALSCLVSSPWRCLAHLLLPV